MLDWRLSDRILRIGRAPLVMGILNVTPDSFSDGGKHLNLDVAVARGIELVAHGADILDIGGESTRPGSESVPLADELGRVVPVVKALASQVSVPISIDTSKAEVARQCLAHGAHIINDVTALSGDGDMVGVARDARAGVILMHMQGTPATMQLNPQYVDVVIEVAGYLQARLHSLNSFGIAFEQVALDPGIGFGKRARDNLEIIRRLADFQRLGRPVCLGVSRKGFVGKLLGDQPVEQRLTGSLAALCYAMSQNAVQIVRVHDVQETRDAVTMFSALAGALDTI